MKTKILLLIAFLFTLPQFALANITFFGNDNTARDCSAIGAWNAPTKTCTMNRDTAGHIIITDPGTTLDGAGHTLFEGSSDTTLGIHVRDAGSVTIKNLHINGFSFGIYFANSPFGTAENNTVNNQWIGISLFSSPNGTLRGNTITGTTGFLGLSVNSSDTVLLENNTVSGYSQNILLDGASFDTVQNNTLSGGYTGIEVRNSSDNTFIENNISGATDMAVYFSDSTSPNSFRNTFSGNAFRGSNVGVLSTLAINTGGGGLMVSFLNTLFPQALALSDNDNVFFHNDFINNTRDVTLLSADLMRFSKPTPDGGNFWDKNTSCRDANADNFCDTPYLADFGVSDDLPRVRSMSARTPALSNPTETEDDGKQDAKGVAGKTKFTFGISYAGAVAPQNVMLWTNDGTITNQYPLAISATTTNDGNFANGEDYTITRTFPKGHYGYHFEANGGAVRFPATGELSFTAGYSNVAFLPGIKASRLFKQGVGFEDQLWEPNWKTDTQDITLNPDGSSVDTDIYTKTDPNDGLIDQANIIPSLTGLLQENFYLNFIDSMDKMVKDKEIVKWKALPYDWRLAFPQILHGGNATINGKIFYDNKYATGTPYILQELRALAKTSDTGKVTIVAHSMGGLLAKKLLHDYSNIVSSTDTLILVDSPQLGTPQAIATLLHGTGENIPNGFGFFTDAKTGRKVSQNMPSVYTLLPSREYFARVTDEGQSYTSAILQNASLRNITDDALFNANTVLDFFQTKYGTTTVTTYNALKDFLGGKDGHFSAPDDDIVHPKIIQMDMLAKAQTIHDEIDNWTPPAGMRAVQIAGWGIPETIRGINYKGKEVSTSCPSPFAGSCKKTIFDVEPMFTFDGDGTVVVPSQTAMNTETYFVDLNGHNAQFLGFKKNRTHGSVFEVKSVRDLIENIIKKVESPANNLDFIKTDKNQLKQAGLKKLLRLSLHSPVKIDVTDKDGNHLGISASSTAIKTVYDTQMPNSYYLEMGEGKYVGFSLSGTTTIQLQGTGTGTFTFNLEQYQGDTREGSQTFIDIPVSTTTKAMLVINTLVDAKELALDQNGDGIIDSVVFTDENKETITFQTLKDEIQTLPEKTNKELLKRAVSAEKQFAKGNYKSAKKKLTKLKKEIVELSETKEKKKFRIENMKALRISAIIDTLVVQIEKKMQETKKKHRGEDEDEDKKKDVGKEHEDDD